MADTFEIIEEYRKRHDKDKALTGWQIARAVVLFVGMVTYLVLAFMGEVSAMKETVFRWIRRNKELLTMVRDFGFFVALCISLILFAEMVRP